MNRIFTALVVIRSIFDCMFYFLRNGVCLKWVNKHEKADVRISLFPLVFQKRRMLGDKSSTQTLRDLEISLRTNHIE